jgi:hypothetical protein
LIMGAKGWKSAMFQYQVFSFEWAFMPRCNHNFFCIAI